MPPDTAFPAHSPSSVPPIVLHAHIVGIVRGREIDAEASLELDAHSLGIVWSQATPWRLALAGIDGINSTVGHLTLYLTSGDVLELSGDDTLRTFGSAIVERACVVPELTRGLRALGSRRGVVGAAHDTWFSPFLAARRAIDGVSDPLRQVALLSAHQLRETMLTVIAELAAVRAPADVATRRAYEAVLEEAAEPMLEAIAKLSIAADALQGSATDTRLLDWRRWMDQLGAVFSAADDGWRSSAEVLGEH